MRRTVFYTDSPIHSRSVHWYELPWASAAAILHRLPVSALPAVQLAVQQRRHCGMLTCEEVAVDDDETADGKHKGLALQGQATPRPRYSGHLGPLISVAWVLHASGCAALAARWRRSGGSAEATGRNRPSRRSIKGVIFTASHVFKP